MKSFKNKMMAIMVLLSFSASYAQIKNQKQETVNISGNCEMCKVSIEKDGNQKNEALVFWDTQTKSAVLTYDEKKTSKEELLKRIALAGYDNEAFLAPASVYAGLPECCQYQRKISIAQVPPLSGDSTKDEKPLQKLIKSYFQIQEGLIAADAMSVSKRATVFLKNIDELSAETFTKDEQVVWLRIQKEIIANATSIAHTKKIEQQRNHFMELSQKMYQLIKATKQVTTVYYQFCPMYNNGKGAYWLSTELTIKNPYYGSQMLSCGRTVETLK